MQTDKQVLSKVRRIWEVKSFEPSLTGYWDVDTTVFDLNDVEFKFEKKGLELKGFYLQKVECKILLIGDKDNFYYEIIELRDDKLKLDLFLYRNDVKEMAKIACLVLSPFEK